MNITSGDLVMPYFSKASNYLDLYIVVGVGPTTDQISCRCLSKGPLGQTYTFFPSEIMYSWKPALNPTRHFPSMKDNG